MISDVKQTREIKRYFRKIVDQAAIRAICVSSSVIGAKRASPVTRDARRRQSRALFPNFIFGEARPCGVRRYRWLRLSYWFWFHRSWLRALYLFQPIVGVHRWCSFFFSGRVSLSVLPLAQIF